MKNRRCLDNILSTNKKDLYIILIIVIFSVLTLTVVYAALSTTLNINGNAEVSAASWDIHLDNVQLNSSSATSNIPTITDSTTATFSTTLSKPGDFYEFTIDVVNDGTIDAVIGSVTKTPTLTETQAKYLNYIVEYQNGNAINTKQLVEKNSFVRLKVKVEFRKDISASDLPTTSETLNLSFTVNYVQSDAAGISVNNNGVIPISANGDIYNIGTIVTIGSEQFYTIGVEGDNLKLFSMYNLYVGGDYNQGWIPYGEEATGMQDENMKGYVSRDTERKGTTSFSSDSKKGTNYSDYNGSIVEEYVNNYKTKIEKFGINVSEATLITKEELLNKGCDLESNTCSNSYAWIYSTSYWTKSPYNDKYVWFVTTKGYLGYTNIATDNSGVGVRPVIIISKDYFQNK